MNTKEKCANVSYCEAAHVLFNDQRDGKHNGVGFVEISSKFLVQDDLFLQYETIEPNGLECGTL